MRKQWESAPLERPAIAAVDFPASLSLGSVRIAPATILAPMAGVTDTVFRRFIRSASFLPKGFTAENAERIANAESAQNPEGKEAPWPAPAISNSTSASSAPSAVNSGLSVHSPANSSASASPAASAVDRSTSACGLIMTEFTSADGVFRSRKSRDRYLHFYEDEHPISAQLFGANPEVIAGAAKMVEDLGFDLVDLNLGCPAKRVVKCNGGSGLLRDLPAIARIFERVRAAVKIPFTVKIRAGWDENEIVCVELARIAQECGLNAIALHARTREQGYSGNARWEWIAAVKSAVKIPVIGNGDIRRPEDACAMVAETKCDAVMIGRTAPANPWIFRQIAQYVASFSKAGLAASGAGRYHQPTNEDRYWMIKTYFEMLIAEELPGAAGKMKQFAAWFTHGIPGGGALRKAIYEARDERAVLANVEIFFESLLKNNFTAENAENAESLGVAACG